MHRWVRVYLLAAMMMSLAITATAQVQVEVQVDAATPLHAIDRGIYGQFLEHFHRVVEHGLWAELLQNRKFYPSDSLEHVHVAPPWTGDPEAKDASYSVDRSISLDGMSSQRLILTQQSGTWRGIRQTGFDVLANKEYVGYAWVRTEASNQRVSFAFESSTGETAARLEAAIEPGDWHQLRFRLKPTRSLYPAVFRIMFSQPGILWIGAASLMPGDNVDGIRKDVLELAKTMAPPLMRWPGGGYADSYDWRKAIGPRDQRPPQLIFPYGNPEGYDSRFDPGDFGTDEFLHFCELVGARPYITVNFGEGNPEMARAWVEYTNGSEKTEWGARRAANGHRQAYNVKEWGVGNESWIPVERGYSTPEGYATYFNQFAAAMRKADAGIRIAAVGFALGGSPEWDEAVARIGGKEADMLSVHYYYALGFLSDYHAQHPVEFYRSLVAAPMEVERLLHQSLANLDRVTGPGKKIQIAFDEWNEANLGKRPPDEPSGFSLARFVNRMNINGSDFNQPEMAALFAARMLHTFMRVGDRIPLACRTHMVNSSGAIRANSTDAYVTASGTAMQLYSLHSGTKLLKSDQKSPTYDVPENGWKGIPSLDAVATVSEDGRRLFLHLLNLDEAQTMNVHIRISGHAVAPKGDVWEIAPTDFLAQNDFGVANVSVQHRQVSDASGEFNQELAPHSATTLELELK
jgi:alpha-N-arabinofuranosidase